MSDLHPVTLFAEGDFEQFANRTLVIDNENVNRVLAQSLSGCFCSLHKVSSHPRQLNYKFGAAILFRDNADTAAVRLYDLVNDGEPQPGSALEIRLQRLKDLGPL